MKVHLAIAVADVTASVDEYTKMLGAGPDLVIPGQYALWRTEVLNLSVRSSEEGPGTIRHVGFERDDARTFETYRDLNGVTWETFNPDHQADEIRSVWPDVAYQPK